MRHRLPLAALAVLLLGAGLPASPCAASRAPFLAQRRADVGGRYYVALSPVAAPGGVSFVWCEAAAGSPPVVDGDQDANTPATALGARPGDRVIGRGTLVTSPVEVRVASSGAGFAAAGDHGGGDGGDALVWVGPGGSVVHRKRLEDLFGADALRLFPSSTAGRTWLEDLWIDEGRRVVVAVGKGDRVRAMELGSGAVRDGTDADVRAAFAHPDPRALRTAFALGAARGMGDTAEAAILVLGEATRSLAGRLQGALALASRGDPRGLDVIRAAAATPAPAGLPDRDREEALGAVARLLGVEALPILLAAFDASPRVHVAASRAVVALGSPAVAALLSAVKDASATPTRRAGALFALGALGHAARGGLDTILDAVGDPSAAVASAAFSAADAIDRPGIADRLARLLERGTAVDDDLAMYFSWVQHPAVVPSLLRLLDRATRGSATATWAVDALRKQTGRDLGDDPARWREVLRIPGK